MSTPIELRQKKAIDEAANWLVTEKHFSHAKAEELAHEANHSIVLFYTQYRVYSPEHLGETEDEFYEHLADYIKQAIIKEINAYND